MRLRVKQGNTATSMHGCRVSLLLRMRQDFSFAAFFQGYVEGLIAAAVVTSHNDYVRVDRRMSLWPVIFSSLSDDIVAEMVARVFVLFASVESCRDQIFTGVPSAHEQQHFVEVGRRAYLYSNGYEAFNRSGWSPTVVAGVKRAVDSAQHGYDLLFNIALSASGDSVDVSLF